MVSGVEHPDLAILDEDDPSGHLARLGAQPKATSGQMVAGSHPSKASRSGDPLVQTGSCESPDGSCDRRHGVDPGVRAGDVRPSAA